jgi:hypothetical protein
VRKTKKTRSLFRSFFSQQQSSDDDDESRNKEHFANTRKKTLFPLNFLIASRADFPPFTMYRFGIAMKIGMV